MSCELSYIRILYLLYYFTRCILVEEFGNDNRSIDSTNATLPVFVDNVHFQNSAQLMKALTAAGVLYEVQVYPDNNHNLAGYATTTHVYRTMTRFLQTDCWHGGEPELVKPQVTADANQKQKTKA